MAQTLAAESPVIDAFIGYRDHLDQHYDKRDRLNQISRDITALSKKVIFALHRLAVTPLSPPPPSSPPAEVSNSQATSAPVDAGTPLERHYAEAIRMELEVRGLFRRVGDVLSEGGGEAREAYWRYARQISGGLQEYIEAVSFLHYLLHQDPPSPAAPDALSSTAADSNLADAGIGKSVRERMSRRMISLEEVQRRVTNENGKPYFPVTAEEYILGLCDLSGELMRYCLNAIAKGLQEEALGAAMFVREIKAQFEPLIPLIPTLAKKQETTTGSLAKCENAVYQLSIRRGEFEALGLGREAVGEIVRRSLEDAEEGEGEREGQGGGEKRDREKGAGARGGRGGGRGGRASKRGRAE